MPSLLGVTNPEDMISSLSPDEQEYLKNAVIERLGAGIAQHGFGSGISAGLMGAENTINQYLGTKQKLAEQEAERARQNEIDRWNNLYKAAQIQNLTRPEPPRWIDFGYGQKMNPATNEVVKVPVKPAPAKTEQEPEIVRLIEKWSDFKEKYGENHKKTKLLEKAIDSKINKEQKKTKERVRYEFFYKPDGTWTQVNIYDKNAVEEARRSGFSPLKPSATKEDPLTKLLNEKLGLTEPNNQGGEDYNALLSGQKPGIYRDNATGKTVHWDGTKVIKVE